MNVSRTLGLLVFIVSMIAIPLLLMGWMLVSKPKSIALSAIKSIVSGLYIFLIYVTGYWAFIGYTLRYIIVGLYAIVAVVTIVRAAKADLKRENLRAFILKHKVFTALSSVICVILMYFIVTAFASFTYHQTPVMLSFPFHNGNYSIIEGGDGKACSLMNYHYSGTLHKNSNVNKSMRYATDIVKVNGFGCFADSLLPKTVERYSIYNDTLYSPISGTVIEVVDGLDNEIPFSGNHPYNVGNHIVIQSDGINVVLGHIEKGSIKVVVGDIVKNGQEIALVGNSGLTEFPHLHIQAMKANDTSIWSGEGVPIMFDGNYPTKNMLFTR